MSCEPSVKVTSWLPAASVERTDDGALGDALLDRLAVDGDGQRRLRDGLDDRDLALAGLGRCLVRCASLARLAGGDGPPDDQGYRGGRDRGRCGCVMVAPPQARRRSGPAFHLGTR